MLARIARARLPEPRTTASPVAMSAAMALNGIGSSSKSSVIVILPRSAPGSRGPTGRSYRTSRATGLPALPMMISSPDTDTARPK